MRPRRSGSIATPGADVVKVEHEVWDKMAELKKSFPPGLDYINIYDPTTFVASPSTK